MAANLWREDTDHSVATPTQQRLAREHAERMKRWYSAGQAAAPAPPPPVIKKPSTDIPPVLILPPDPVGSWLASWRVPAMLSVRLIQSLVAGHYGTTRSKLIGDQRLAALVFARHVAMWLSLEMLNGATLPAVGRAFRRDHTTVLHGRNRIRKLIADDPAFAQEVEDLRQQVLKAAEPAL